MWKFRQFMSIIRWVIRDHGFSVFFPLSPANIQEYTFLTHFSHLFPSKSIKICPNRVFNRKNRDKMWPFVAHFMWKNFTVSFFHDGGWRKNCLGVFVSKSHEEHVYTGDVLVWYSIWVSPFLLLYLPRMRSRCTMNHIVALTVAWNKNVSFRWNS